ncbi:twin arginine-targeting protein translocase TatC [gamma proteobacterium HTCC5015]|nr:twin arginine-targeting protein translocase TatC [gamma proteobacterium HTCC5015]
MSADSGGETLVSHLVELRSRLVRMVLCVILVFLPLIPISETIYDQLAAPMMSQLPLGSSMIAIDVASPFLVPFKVSFILALMISMPYLLFQLWSFIAPGLYLHERRLATPLIVSSTLLFYLGSAFAYFVVLPLVFGFFVSVAPQSVSVMTDLGRYLDFVLALFLAFGLAFEIPVATVLLVLVGWVQPAQLSQARPYVIVGVFVVAMLLTPPDVISQTLLAIPMLALYETGIIFSRLVQKRRAPE